MVVTKKNTMKRVRLNSFEITSRARKGVLIVRDVKTNPYYILKAFITSSKNYVGLKTKNDINYIKLTEVPIADRYSTGSNVSKLDLLDVFIKQELAAKEVKEEKKIESPSLEEINDKILTIDDFLDDFKIEWKYINVTWKKCSLSNSVGDN